MTGLSDIEKVAFIEFAKGSLDIRSESEKSTGLEYRAVCPFCHGGPRQEVSFDVNIDKGVVRCWRAASCNYRASAAWFISEILEISYTEAVDYLMGDLSDPEKLLAHFEDFQDELHARYETREHELFDDNGEVWHGHFKPLVQTGALPRVKEWLEGRGYDPDQFIEDHELYWPDQYYRNKDGIPIWKDRVVFKVSSLDRVAYLAYAISPDVQPKTRNPPGGVLSSMLYNYNHVQDAQTVFVCEGIFDAARLKSWGVFAVSLFGLSMSERQIYLFSKLKAHEIVFCLDNGTMDVAVKMAKELEPFSGARVISILNIGREGADPDDLTEDEFLHFYSKRKYLKVDDESILRRLERDL
jgi:hypothetical protein